MLQIAARTLALWIAAQGIQARPYIQPSNLEQQINTLINSERRANALIPLVPNASLSKVARSHSQNMVNRGYFNHVDPDGKGPGDRLRIAGYSCPNMYGENIFQNNLYTRVTIRGNQRLYDWNSLNEIAASTVKGWMSSPGHRRNILEKDYLHTGIGVAFAANGQVFITQVFCG